VGFEKLIHVAPIANEDRVRPRGADGVCVCVAVVGMCLCDRLLVQPVRQHRAWRIPGGVAYFYAGGEHHDHNSDVRDPPPAPTPLLIFSFLKPAPPTSCLLDLSAYAPVWVQGCILGAPCRSLTHGCCASPRPCVRCRADDCGFSQDVQDRIESALGDR
jgi:hypothetical protein